MAMKRRKRGAILALRGVLLLAFLGLLGLVVFVLVDFGRSAQAGTAENSENLDSTPGDDAQFETRGTFLRQAFQQGDGQTILIAGDAYQVDREDNVFLQGARIELEREEGTYVITSETAWFNRRTQQAKLETEVEVRGPRGLRLWTDWLELQQGGNVLIASRGTRFAIEGTAVGSAETLRADFERRILALSGGVEVRTEDHVVPASSLRAERLWIYELSHLVRAEGMVELRQGLSNWLTTKRLTLFLDEANRSVLRVRAMWRVRAGLEAVANRGANGALGLVEEPPRTAAASTEVQPVAGDLELLAAGEQITLSGLSLAVHLDQTSRDPAAFVLAGLVRAPATVSTTAKGGGTRRMTALKVVGSFIGGVLQATDATGGVTLEETFQEGGVRSRRSMTGQTAHLAFNDVGEMARLDMNGEVRLEERSDTGSGHADMTAVGDSAQFHFVLNRFDLTGAPTATVTNASGTMTAPEFSYDEASGLLHAIGGVRAEFEAGAEGALTSAALNDGDDPIRVEAEEALLRRGSDEFLFKTRVRAWKGRDVLLAERLQGERVGERQSLAGSGGVKTLWFSDSETLIESGQDEADEASAPVGPIQIESEIFSYLEGGSETTVVYEGGVRVLQAGRVTACDKLRVELDDEGEAETMFFEGSFHLDDPEPERTVDAERATYFVADEIIEIFGDPLTIRDGKHNMSVFHAIYRLEDGSLQLGQPQPNP